MKKTIVLYDSCVFSLDFYACITNDVANEEWKHPYCHFMGNKIDINDAMATLDAGVNICTIK